MEKKEQRRLGRKEKPVPEKNPEEYSAAELMRIARQQAGKTLADTAKELKSSAQYLSHVETGKQPASTNLAKQYEQLFGQEPGQIIIKVVYERPLKNRKQQEPPSERK